MSVKNISNIQFKIILQTQLQRMYFNFPNDLMNAAKFDMFVKYIL